MYQIVSKMYHSRNILFILHMQNNIEYIFLPSQGLPTPNHTSYLSQCPYEMCQKICEVSKIPKIPTKCYIEYIEYFFFKVRNTTLYAQKSTYTLINSVIGSFFILDAAPCIFLNKSRVSSISFQIVCTKTTLLQILTIFP